MADYESREKICKRESVTMGVVSTPTAQNVIAWGNAPGETPASLGSAEGAKWETVNRKPRRLSCLNIILRFQRLGRVFNGSYLGRWPRLLHFAPLALRSSLHPARYREWFCTG